jgi:hypothetical protein
VRLRRAGATSGLAGLLALFQAGHEVPLAEASRVFGSALLDELVDWDILRH